MRLIGSAFVTITSVCILAFAQGTTDSDLAALLASEATRQTAVNRIVAGGKNEIPLLLSWARRPPAGVAKFDLFQGLIMAFGQLRAEEAIPFLVENISLQHERLAAPNIWLKTPEVIRQRLPTVAALVQIGPAASNALIHSYWDRLEGNDRLAALFVISQVKGVPEAPDFLRMVAAQANAEHIWAQEGLKLLQGETGDVHDR